MRSVSLARAELHDARVPTGTVGEPGGDVRKELMDDVVRAKRGERQSPGVDVAALAQM